MFHFFFKQWGGLTPKSGGRILDDKIWNEFPNSNEKIILKTKSLDIFKKLK